MACSGYPDTRTDSYLSYASSVCLQAYIFKHKTSHTQTCTCEMQIIYILWEYIIK